MLIYNIGSEPIFCNCNLDFCELIIQNTFFIPFLQNILAERRVDLTALLVQLMRERDSRAEQLRQRLVRREYSIIHHIFCTVKSTFCSRLLHKKCLTVKGR